MPWTGRPEFSTAEHKRWAREVLRRAQGKCQVGGPDCTGVAEQADHIVPVAEGGAEYDVENGQGICIPDHKAKTSQETARGRARYYGRARRQPEQHPSERWD